LAETLEKWQGRLESTASTKAFTSQFRRSRQVGTIPPSLQSWPARSWPRSNPDNWLEDELTAVRLRILEACGRTEEYLNLARAARVHTSYAAMLVKLERTAEAIEHAPKSFRSPMRRWRLPRCCAKRRRTRSTKTGPLEKLPTKPDIHA
jgi:hypothetical protein